MVAMTPQSAPMSDPGLFDKWKDWLGAPQNRAALLQTGLSLMQPVQMGQSQFGHIASSIGQGLGAAGRAEGRIAKEKLSEEDRARQIEGENLDREIKRSGLELDRMNTQSMIGDRAKDTALAQSRLGLDTEESKLSREKTALEIENAKKGGGLTLDKMFGAAKDIAETSGITGRPVAETTADYVEAMRLVQEGLGQGQQRGQLAPGQTPPSPAPTTSDTRILIKRNPQTGQQVILKDGKWVPYP